MNNNGVCEYFPAQYTVACYKAAPLRELFRDIFGGISSSPAVRSQGKTSFRNTPSRTPTYVVSRHQAAPRVDA